MFATLFYIKKSTFAVLMNGICRNIMLSLALMAVAAFSILAIHHHHYDKVVPIVVELFGVDKNADDSDCGEHHCHHSSAHKCDNHSSVAELLHAKFQLQHQTAICVVAESVAQYQGTPIIILYKDLNLPLTDRKGIMSVVRGPPEYSFIT